MDGATQRVAIALGSNLGDRRATILGAAEALSCSPGVAGLVLSSFHETAPVGSVPQGPYLNAAATLVTAHEARALLGVMQAVEVAFGRDRANEVRWGPRTLDLDLILYGDRMIEEPGLRVPHPRMHERLFVLDPLAEVAGAWTVPGPGRTVRELRDALRGEVHSRDSIGDEYPRSDWRPR